MELYQAAEMKVDLTGFDRLIARFRRIMEPNAAALAANWMKVIEEDNRKGILAGTDKDGAPLRAVTSAEFLVPCALFRALAQGNNEAMTRQTPVTDVCFARSGPEMPCQVRSHGDGEVT